MPKPNTLEALLSALDKAEKLLVETQELKPRLEAEINSALDSGDALDEKIAIALQIKRAQFDMCPAKLTQIENKIASLTSEILEVFNPRMIAFNRALEAKAGGLRKKISKFIAPLLPELQIGVADELAKFIYLRTKLSWQLVGLESPIRSYLSSGRQIEAAKQLLQSEKELAKIQAP